MSMKEEKLKEAAKLNQLKYVFSEEVNKATISELKTIGVGNFVDGANWAINKACEFLTSYRRDYPDGTGYVAGIIDDETIEDFKKYMYENYGLRKSI